MATYRPKFGYSAWEVPATPLKRQWDWAKIGVWAGILALCVGFWGLVILACAKAV